VSTTYSTVIQVSLGTTAGGGAITISNATINSVSGMPAGFTYSTNPVSGTIPAGSDACLIFAGTPATPGTYTITVSLSVNTNFGPTTQSAVWYLTVNTLAGIRSYDQVLSFVISPNPATSELFISSTSHFGKVQIVDALGNTVISHDANYSAQTTINISALSKDIYFLQVNDGTNLTTKKFIKD
jgi:hypothetical protein